MPQLIELTDRSGLDYLHELVGRAQDMRPVLAEIGEDMVESTKGRFASATAPDGSAWAPNSPLTLARYGSMFAPKTAAKKVAGKKPGTGETRMLGTTINYQLPSGDAVSIGSPMVYAGTFHYGAKSGEFGFGIYATRNGSFPIPWGDIPGRPFLGASADDKANIVNLVRSYLMEG
ncbi:phage virion morphogenesis protein [Paracidovorax anthurii]|uniref:Virion morphogenesis family protein n=1 Tax=Paracidovorax anthurii TaxID=78229 RepID=A0A328ZL28_9BURK|nr:phage virion morphogenesis protein [Paracidovorax anthurii]RAR86095.1 virion morphogenesis family protein [Paracidovorax anthurii]